jgi:hypothetical protein
MRLRMNPFWLDWSNSAEQEVVQAEVGSKVDSEVRGRLRVQAQRGSEVALALLRGAGCGAAESAVDVASR